jgi:CBS domain-containing protein
MIVSGMLKTSQNEFTNMFSLDVLMTTDLITVSPDATLADARKLMKDNRIRHLPVVEGDRKLVGLLTQTDVLAATDSRLREEDNRIHANEVMVRDVMITKIATIDAKASLRRAALFLETHRIGCLPVVTGDRLVGIITDTDFVGIAINLLEQLEELEPPLVD